MITDFIESWRAKIGYCWLRIPESSFLVCGSYDVLKWLYWSMTDIKQSTQFLKFWHIDPPVESPPQSRQWAYPSLSTVLAVLSYTLLFLQHIKVDFHSRVFVLAIASTWKACALHICMASPTPTPSRHPQSHPSSGTPCPFMAMYHTTVVFLTVWLQAGQINQYYSSPWASPLYPSG